MGTLDHPLRQRQKTLERKRALDGQLRATIEAIAWDQKPAEQALQSLRKDVESLIRQGASPNQWIRREDGSCSLLLNLVIRHDTALAIHLLTHRALANQETLLFLAHKAEETRRFFDMCPVSLSEKKSKWHFDEACRMLVLQPGLDWYALYPHQEHWCLLEKRNYTVAHSLDVVMADFSLFLEQIQAEKGWRVGRALPTPAGQEALDLALWKTCDNSSKREEDLDDKEAFLRIQHLLSLGGDPNFKKNKNHSLTDLAFIRSNFVLTDLLLSHGGRVGENFIGKALYEIEHDEDFYHLLYSRGDEYKQMKTEKLRRLLLRVIKAHPIQWQREVHFSSGLAWTVKHTFQLSDLVENTLPDLVCQAQAQELSHNTACVEKNTPVSRRL